MGRDGPRERERLVIIGESESDTLHPSGGARNSGGRRTFQGMVDRMARDARQRAVDCARQIVDGRCPPDEGARRLTAELLPSIGQDPQTRQFAESFAGALAERQEHPTVRRRTDERIRLLAWRLIAAWR